MKRKIILLFTLVFLACNYMHAQKIEIVSGDLGFLKGQKEIKIEYSYKDVKVGKLTEEEYITKKVSEHNEKEPGSGDKWLADWKNDRSSRYEPRFDTLFNKYMNEKGVTASVNAKDAKYIIEVHTTDIDPGFNVGVMRKPALLNFTITFKEIASSQEVAVLQVLKSTGTGAMGYDFDSGLRISESFAKCGKALAKFLIGKAKL